MADASHSHDNNGFSEQISDESLVQMLLNELSDNPIWSSALSTSSSSLLPASEAPFLPAQYHPPAWEEALKPATAALQYGHAPVAAEEQAYPVQLDLFQNVQSDTYLGAMPLADPRHALREDTAAEHLILLETGRSAHSRTTSSGSNSSGAETATSDGTLPNFDAISENSWTSLEASPLSYSAPLSAPALVSPTSQQNSTIHQQELPPTSQQVSPLPQQVSPMSQQVSPLPQQVSPMPQQVSPLPQHESPMPQQVSPEPAEGAHEASPSEFQSAPAQQPAKRPGRPEKDRTGAPNLLCLVCQEKAGQHSYYGGQVCTSCRAFFRRAVQTKYYEIFACSKEKQCVVNVKTRRSCQFCRFKKCLAAGMRVAWVLPEGERTRRFNKLNKATHRNEFSSAEASNKGEGPATQPVAKSKPAPGPRRRPVLPAHATYQNELAAIADMHRQVTGICTATMQDYLISHPGFMKQMTMLSYFGGKVTYSFFKEFSSMTSCLTQAMFWLLPEFQALPRDDKQKLIECNGELIQHFKLAVAILEVNSCLISGIEKVTKSGRNPFIEEQHQELTKRKPLFANDQFYSSPWAPTYEEEKRHFLLMQKMKAWPRDSEDSDVDDVQMTLIKLVMAFNTDGLLGLERPDLCQAAQEKYAHMLRTYLHCKYGRDTANSRFGQGLMMVSYVKEAQDILNKQLPV